MPLQLNSTNVTKCDKFLIFEIIFRIILFIIYLILDSIEPFKRHIRPEEMWQYGYPVIAPYVPGKYLLSYILSLPTLVALFCFYRTRNRIDLLDSILGFTLSLGLTGLLTVILKIVIGRPRPCFLARCFPNGVIDTKNFICTSENIEYALDGRKSFPSGHSSLSFSSMVYLSLFIAGKLHIFNDAINRIRGIKIAIFLSPIISATLIAISRTCDYHHHWQDVLVGILIGTTMSIISYRQYYPSITNMNSHLPTSLILRSRNEEMLENQQLLTSDTKWI